MTTKEKEFISISFATFLNLVKECNDSAEIANCSIDMVKELINTIPAIKETMLDLGEFELLYDFNLA